MQPITCANFSVRVFSANNPYDLEQEVNEWLVSGYAEGWEVIDTTFQVCPIYPEKHGEKETYVLHNMALYLRKFAEPQEL